MSTINLLRTVKYDVHNMQYKYEYKRRITYIYKVWFNSPLAIKLSLLLRAIVRESRYIDFRL